MEGPLFVLSHETAIPLHIGTQDGSEFAFNFLGHGILLQDFVNGRIERTFYKILALEWFRALQGGKKPLGGFISAPFGSTISSSTPKG
jgi:hypothetical protein